MADPVIVDLVMVGLVMVDLVMVDLVMVDLVMVDLVMEEEDTVLEAVITIVREAALEWFEKTFYEITANYAACCNMLHCVFSPSLSVHHAMSALSHDHLTNLSLLDTSAVLLDAHHR